MASRVQIDSQGRVKLNPDGLVILADEGDPCCCGGGASGEPCSCSYVIFRECPGDDPTLCCSALEFDLITTIRAETTTTIDPAAWGLLLFGYEPIAEPVPEDGVLLDGYFEYENTTSVRCVKGVRVVTHTGAFRWALEWYDGTSAINNTASGEVTWTDATTGPGVTYGHTVDYGAEIVTGFSSDLGSAFEAVSKLYPPLLATQTDCVETYGVGSILTTVTPYVFVPVNFAFGGTQLSGTGTTSADCTFRTSSMRFEWDFLGSGGATYGTSVQTWEMSDQTIVYTECDPDPCDLL